MYQNYPLALTKGIWNQACSNKENKIICSHEMWEKNSFHTLYPMKFFFQ